VKEKKYVVAPGLLASNCLMAMRKTLPGGGNQARVENVPNRLVVKRAL
jgi:hypothetical protein